MPQRELAATMVKAEAVAESTWTATTSICVFVARDSDDWGWDVEIPQVAFHTEMPYSVTESDIPPKFSFDF